MKNMLALAMAVYLGSLTGGEVVNAASIRPSRNWDFTGITECLKTKSRVAAALCVVKWSAGKIAEHEAFKILECIYDGNSIKKCLPALDTHAEN